MRKFSVKRLGFSPSTTLRQAQGDKTTIFIGAGKDDNKKFSVSLLIHLDLYQGSQLINLSTIQLPPNS